MGKYEFRRRDDKAVKENDDGRTLLSYLRCFDPIEKKYNFDESNQLPFSMRALASEYEDSFQFGNITKHEYGYIQENLELVYNDPGSVKDDIAAYYLTETRFIHRYLSIPQLDKMFDEDYFNFEWDMHVGRNFQEHRNDYYRDHYIHQIRNMYMMMILLDEFGFFDAAADCLAHNFGNKISDYFSKKYHTFISGAHSEQLKLLEDLFVIYSATPSGRGIDKAKYITNYYYKYVIYASSMMAALFHDMGYPIVHFLETRHRLSAYNPTLHMFTQNTTDSFDELAALLNESLLFTIVSGQQIKESLRIDKKNKYNHGAYSAIAFLLQFYNNGAIFSLSPEKQCAIEFAALAIYNHTCGFSIVDDLWQSEPKNNHRYYAPFFQQNPISFLLRFCDDLQEWDRRYFEISNASDLIFCKECGAPFLKKTGKHESSYYCMCKDKGEMRRPDVFTKRKIYLVSVADSVSIEHADDGESLIAHINYDYYKLLTLSNTNETYAKHRINELVKLKKLIALQDFRSANFHLAFRYINIRYFMTANPLLIKLKILELYLSYYDPLNGGVARKLPLECEDLGETISSMEGLESAFISNFHIGVPLYKFLVDNKAIKFYLDLLLFCLASKSMKKISYANFIDEYKQRNPFYFNVISSLADDCIKYYEMEKLLRSFGDSAPIHKEYYEPGRKDGSIDYLCHCVGIYTEQKNNFNNYNDPSESGEFPYISYYKDLLLFYEMNEKLRELSW